MLKRNLFLIFLAVFQCMASAGQDSSSQPVQKEFGIFAGDDIFDVILKFDITTYLRKKPRDEFLKAEMTLIKGTDTIRKEIRIKTRGKFRHSYCALAPIELNFKKVEFGYSDLDSLNKLKLVSQCSWGTAEEKYVIKEYLVYKLYNVLTDTSYKVQLLRLTYLDSERERKPITQYGFFIEPDEMLAKRINAIELKTTSLNQKHIVPVVMDRIALFNYMIGNYDWSVPGLHNISIFKRISPSLSQYAIAVPYDFDWSGVVNASYAIPAENVGLNSVRERLFQGICRQENVFRSELDDFAQHKDDFYRIINSSTQLRQRDKDDTLSFLDGFFDQLNGSRNNLIYTLRNSCKNF